MTCHGPGGKDFRILDLHLGLTSEPRPSASFSMSARLFLWHPITLTVSAHTCDAALTGSTHALFVASSLQSLKGGQLQTLLFCIHLEATLCSRKQGLRDEKQVLIPNVCACRHIINVAVF